MTVGDFLQQGTAKLSKAGIDSARLDCLLLLEDTLHMDRARLLAHPELLIDEAASASLLAQCEQRATHTPLAYLRGKASFYGRSFMITSDVLVPRPETETMVTLAKELTNSAGLPAQPRFVDIGTGSGCIGISVALEIPGSVVSLYDIDPNVLTVARKNAQVLGAHVTTAIQNLLSDPPAAEHTFAVVLANLPYVPDAYPINTAATFEPKLALFAGPDGLDLYRTLWQQIAALPVPPVYVLTESLIEQHAALAELAEAAGYKLAQQKGLIQQFVR
jgi:release factor glutamine methyltransferase